MTGLLQPLTGIDHKHFVIGFCGVGFSTHAVELALGKSPDVAINHDPKAIAIHKLNHPGMIHFCDDVWNVSRVWDIPRGPVRGIWISPACQMHSQAFNCKATPREEQQRALCEVLLPFLDERRPEVAFLENVAPFENWGPLDEEGEPIKALMGTYFRKFVADIRARGYSCEWRVLNSADYGMPQSRRRLYMICRADGKPAVWPAPTHGPGLLSQLPAFDCLDFSLPTNPIWDYVQRNGTPGHTVATHRRMAIGFVKFCLERPPIIVDEAAWIGAWNGNGEHAKQAPRTWDLLRPLPTSMAGGVKQRLCAFWLRKDNGKTWGQPLDEPMHTVTCKDTKRLMRMPLGESSPKVREWFAKWLPGVAPVVPIDGVDYPIADITERLLHPRELARSMGIPDSYKLPPKNTAAIRGVGNGVTVEPAVSIVRANVEPLEEWKPPKRRAS